MSDLITQVIIGKNVNKRRKSNLFRTLHPALLLMPKKLQ